MSPTNGLRSRYLPLKGIIKAKLWLLEVETEVKCIRFSFLFTARWRKIFFPKLLDKATEKLAHTYCHSWKMFITVTDFGFSCRLRISVLLINFSYFHFITFLKLRCGLVSAVSLSWWSEEGGMHSSPSLAWPKSIGSWGLIIKKRREAFLHLDLQYWGWRQPLWTFLLTVSSEETYSAS